MCGLGACLMTTLARSPDVSARPQYLFAGVSVPAAVTRLTDRLPSAAEPVVSSGLTWAAILEALGRISDARTIENL